MKLCATKSIVSWTLQIMVAAILFQTLFFKFTGALESKFIFSALGVEPWGRIAAGALELVAGVLLLIPRSVVFGAVLALVVMVGALAAHFTKLGLVVQDDGGLLFVLAVTVFVFSSLILVFRRAQIPLLGHLVSNANSCEAGTYSIH